MCGKRSSGGLRHRSETGSAHVFRIRAVGTMQVNTNALVMPDYPLDHHLVILKKTTRK